MIPKPEVFEEEYPPEELDTKLPDRPMSSLRDIQYLYGLIYTLATAGGGDYASYLTPNEAADLIDEDESLIVVRADLSGSTPQLDVEKPVQITQYAGEDVELVAHSKFEAARGIDHSITHRSGQDSDPDKLARYAQERFTKWATDEVVAGVASDHEDGWIIERLLEVGEDTEEMERLEEAVEAQLGGPTTVLLTVRVKLEEDGGYQWPGEIPVFGEAMRERKLSKLVSKNEATDSAGQATDLVTDADARTVGTAEDPLNYFLGKQMEKFPGFDPDEAWRTHPISEDAAVTVMSAGEFIDGCTYSTYGTTVYYLPYFLGNIGPEEVYHLYAILYEVIQQDDITPIEEAYERFGDAGLESYGSRLRFYVAAVMKHQMSRYDVYSDTMDCELIYPLELARTHRAVLDSWVFDADGFNPGPTSAPMPTSDGWSLLESGERDYLRTVSTGMYFRETFSRSDSDQDADADDERIQALISVLSGEALSVETVLGEFVERLLDDEGDRFPNYRIASQFAQLCALADADLLTAETDRQDPITEGPNYDTPQSMHTTDTRIRADGGATRAAARAEKLAQFIDDTPAFEHGERRAAFLLGVLVGQVGSYQQTAEGRSTTVVDQYSIKSMTKNRLKRVIQEVLDKNVVYSRENNMGSTMYAEVVDRLVETISRTDREPEHWELRTDDLRFYYGLGVAYGFNDYHDDQTEN